ncbi:leucine rich repeat protein, bspa family protein [Pelomyxa schiedti]|nr:leucine rich repeat protein, bspa family protein [Pelomyxa schiedti]
MPLPQPTMQPPPQLPVVMPPQNAVDSQQLQQFQQLQQLQRLLQQQQRQQQQEQEQQQLPPQQNVQPLQLHETPQPSFMFQPQIQSQSQMQQPLQIRQGQQQNLLLLQQQQALLQQQQQSIIQQQAFSQQQVNTPNPSAHQKSLLQHLQAQQSVTTPSPSPSNPAPVSTPATPAPTPINPTSVPSAPTSNTGSGVKPRKKLWVCTYPLCTNTSPKTYYNCYSHVWDAHVRHELAGATEPGTPANLLSALVYKKLEDRDAVKHLCVRYIAEIPDLDVAGGPTAKKRKHVHPHQNVVVPNSLPFLPNAVQPCPVSGEFYPQYSPYVDNTFSLSQPHFNTPPVDTMGKQMQPCNFHPLSATMSNGNTPLPTPTTVTTTTTTTTDCSATPAQKSLPLTPVVTLPLTMPLKQKTSAEHPVVEIPIIPNVHKSSPSSGDGDNPTDGSPNGTSSHSTPSAAPSLPQSPNGNNEVELSVLPRDKSPTIRTQDPNYPVDENEFMKIVSLTESLRRLHVCGEIFAENGFLQRSDARFKHNIQPLQGALDKVMTIAGKSFQYKDDPAVKLGFIAQELKQVVPEVVREDTEGLSVDVVGLVPLIVEALKELHTSTKDARVDQFLDLHRATEDALSKVRELEAQISVMKQNSGNYIDSDRTLMLKYSVPRRNTIHYDATFGPPFLVFMLLVIFTVGGIILPFVLPSLPFVWAYCWLAVLLMGASLWKQRREVIDMVKYKEIKLYWYPSHTINMFLLSLVALTGLTLSTVMGTVPIKVVGIFLAGLLVFWGFSIVAHKKFDVSFHAIFVVLFSGITAAALGYVLLFLIQPYECFFSGYDHNFEYYVQLGEPVGPLPLSALPWNCPSYTFQIITPLPANISMHNSGVRDVPPYLAGEVGSLFDTQTSDVYLVCADVVKFFCGGITFKACVDRDDRSSCEANGCGWCSTSTSDVEQGYCGDCDGDFISTCESLPQGGSSSKDGTTYSTAACSTAALQRQASNDGSSFTPLRSAMLITLLLLCVV